MPGWRTLAVDPEIEVRVAGAMQPLPPDLDAVVDAHWRAACRTMPLFNGAVFCADTVTPGLITGHWTEYRRVLAQLRQPELRAALGVRSLAVCGVTRCADGVLLGRRTRRTPYQAGAWQLPPAGSVDANCAYGARADLRRAVLLELEEEVGLPPSAVDAVRPLCLVEHPGGTVLDLGLLLTTQLTAAAVLAAHATTAGAEYEELIVVPERDVGAAVRSRGGTLVMPALILLAAASAADGAPGRALGG